MHDRRRKRGRPRRGERPPGRAPGREPAAGASRLAELCELSPFSLFCALHLGITETDGFAPPSRGSTARRFERSVDCLDAYAREHGVDLSTLESRGFDLASARLDIEMAPEGISRTELARTLFEDLQKPEDPSRL